MPVDFTHPVVGDPGVDCSSLAMHLVDLPEEAMRGMLTAQEGFVEVILEIISNQAAWGEKAGITSSDFANFELSCDIVDKIDMYLPVARKLVEMLLETRALHEDRRQRIARAIAAGVERRAMHNAEGTELLARYQKTRVYRSAIGRKGYKTRQRNLKAMQAQNEATPEVESG